MTGYIEADVKNLLLQNGKIKTYEHVKAVADRNIVIAEMFGLDQTICRIGGLLHDISVIIRPADMLDYFETSNLFIDESERRYPFILHQRVSKLLAQSLFQITDPDILSSVECHSTLKGNPSNYDMALFIADKLSWDQDGKPPFYDDVYNQLSVSLECACLTYINYVIDHKMILYPHSWFQEAKTYLLSKI